MGNEWKFLIIWIVFLAAISLLALYLQWDSNRNEREEKAEEERKRDCKHRNGFTILKVFGHPDLKECNDCGRVFEMDGSEVSRRYLDRLLDDTDEWIENSDGGRELKIYLTREQFRKIYRISMERKMTMDDMIRELIDGLKK